MDAFLNSILRGLIYYRTGIYVLLGLGLLLFIRKFFVGWREWQRAVFGLERKIAQRKLVSATSGLVLLIFLLLGEFLLVTVIGPQMRTQPMATISTDNLINETASLLSGGEDQVDMPVANPLSTDPQESPTSECIENVLEITYPQDGDVVSGTVDIIGSVNIDNFGSYKYEYSSVGDINWITIAADNQLKLDESLGFWFTSSLIPGRYLLQLVPLNNVGEELTPCIINIEVVQEE